MRRSLATLLTALLSAAPALGQVEAGRAVAAPGPAGPASVLTAPLSAPRAALNGAFSPLAASPSALLPAPALAAAPAPSLPGAPAPAAVAPAAAPAPRLVHAGLRMTPGGFQVAVTDGKTTTSREVSAPRRTAYRDALAWLKSYASKNGATVVFVGLSAPAPRRFTDALWLEQDAVPVPTPGAADAAASARAAAAGFTESRGLSWPLVGAGPDGEVRVADLTGLAPYRRGVSAEDWRALRAEAKRSPGPIAFFSSTPQGGGVALMRHAAIRLLRLLGVDAKWYVLDPDAEVFKVTKRKIHNVLQAVAPEGVELNEGDKALIRAWWARQAAKFEPVFRRAAVVVIDDYQPSGLIPFIQAVNPGARILYRSHIQIRADLAATPGTPQNRTWGFLRENILRAAVFVSHPMEAFVPKDVPREKVFFAPATTDPLDGLNKPLSAERRARLLDAFDLRLAENGQAPLDRARPYMVQVARFDPSKGIPTVLEAYSLLRERLRREGVPDAKAPQLVFAGHGAVDDAEGGEVFQKTLDLIRTRYPKWAGDIKAASLPHSDQILGAVLRGASFALQLSYAEGFEVKVTEALLKGVPVIGSTAGGIPLQIKEGRTGLLVPPADPVASAEAMHRLVSDPASRARLSRAAARERPPFLTQHALLRWLRLARQ